MLTQELNINNAVKNEFSYILVMSIGMATKMLRLEATPQNITEAIKTVLWDIPTTTSSLLITKNSPTMPDKAVCSIGKENLFNKVHPFITPKEVDFEGNKFKSTAGLDPVRDLALWLLEQTS